MSTSSRYDYIIAGAGCAGLSLAMQMIQSGQFGSKKILLVDKDLKKANDRTWCFWQQGSSLFENIVCRQWENLWFHGKAFSRLLDIEPYHYKMIRGADFYEHCFQTISQHHNFHIAFEKVELVFSEEETGIIIGGKKIFAEYVFNSIVFEKPLLAKNEYWLLQHFKGWIIETPNGFFDEQVATLMDFRTDQRWGTAFCYVLPLSSRQALVEYTLFSKELLQEEKYDKGLRSYIETVLNISSFNILGKEFGVIPMTNFKFPANRNRIINIGTAGGQTKGSSGYTFQFIQKHSRAIVDSMITTGNPFVKTSGKRFRFYDGVLLKVLTDQTVAGDEVFTDLFRKNATDKVFRFLDNETSIAEEMKIISSLPTIPFLKAGIHFMS